jgi:hypothetical protein
MDLFHYDSVHICRSSNSGVLPNRLQDALCASQTTLSQAVLSAVKCEFSRIPPNSLIPSQIEFRLN